MPLNVATLATAMDTELNTVFPVDPDRGIDPADRRRMCTAIATAVVDHLKASAVVTGTCPPGVAGGPLTLGRVT